VLSVDVEKCEAGGPGRCASGMDKVSSLIGRGLSGGFVVKAWALEVVEAVDGGH
jgi:hypothetical protein